MTFGNTLKELITNKPANLREPLFYKTENSAESQLEKMKALLETAPAALKDKIEQDIRSLSYGITGEDQIAFELQNSHLPIIILHDLRLEFEDLSTQIDYLIITNKFNLVLECKNLYGDMEVTSSGDFIRTSQYRGQKSREGIYSPITQNQRHLELIRKIRLAQRTNALSKALVDKFFSSNYQSLVVLANPKTVLNSKYAPKEIKEQIIRADQLVQTIKSRMNAIKDATSTEKDMYELAEFFLNQHKQNPIDYLEKYRSLLNKGQTETPTHMTQTEQLPEQTSTEAHSAKPSPQLPLEQTPRYQDLKKYRFETSQLEGVKAYFVYTNAELESIIAADPASIDELRKINGFGEVKCQKYGPAILEILAKHR
jgi:hypothetical protein